MPEETGSRVVRKERPPLSRRGLKIGDRVRVIDIPADLKDPNYDRKHPDDEHRVWRTGELFRFCLGRVFTIYGFERYGHVELQVGQNREVKKEFGWSHTIWIEPEHLKVVRKKRGTKSLNSGLSK